MYQPAGTTLVTASRERWSTFCRKAEAAGRGDVSNYVNDTVGMASGEYVSVALDADRYATYQSLMDPVCSACGLNRSWHDDGACPELAPMEVA
jgi:hypothetical protein